MDIPGWVRHACEQWGRQKRRIWSGMDWHGNVDGYAQSLLGRIREEREGATQGQRGQYWPEVYLGEGLNVQRALATMQERPYDALHLKYVWDPRWEISASRKARILGLNRTAYFEVIGKGESFVLRALESGTDSQLVEQVQQIIRQALSNGSQLDTRAQACRPSLDFTPLRRTVLTRNS